MTENNGREAAKDNDLFFTCSLIDYIARKTQNTRADVVNMLGAEKVEKIYDLADIYHSDNIERVSDDFIREAGIRNGEFDNVKECNYAIPSHWDIGNQLGKERLEKIYDLADVYHCDNIERVSDDFIEEAQIGIGTFDNVGECKYSIPSHWDIGKVYKRLIKAVAEHEKIGIIEALFKVYNSFLSTKIDDYNSSMYYENPAYLLECYLESRVI